MRYSCKMLSMFLIIIGKSFGGWFICYTYEDMIEDKPLIVTIQIDCRPTFENCTKPDVYISGFYDRYDEYPIHGSFDPATRVAALQISNKATMNLDLSGSKTIGHWSLAGSKKKIPLKPQCLSQLIDTFNIFKGDTSLVKSRSQPGMNVVMCGSTKDRYFIGVYRYDYLRSQDSAVVCETAHLTKIKIMNKKDCSLFQEIKFTEYNEYDYDCFVGNMCTIICGNIIVGNNETFDIFLRNRYGRMEESFLKFKYDSNSNKYIEISEENEQSD